MRSVLSLGIARSRRRAPSKSASEGPNLPALKSSRTRSFAEGWRDENYSRDEPATVALPRTWWDCPFRAHRIEVSTGWLAHLNDGTFTDKCARPTGRSIWWSVDRGVEKVTEPAKSTRVSLIESSIPIGAVPLESIVCTQELRNRPSRLPEYEKENLALAALASALANSPNTILQTLADRVFEVVHADSAGLSLLTKDEERFYWAAVAGAWQPHIGDDAPRNFGPCGDVLNHNSPMLFAHWERRYPYLSWTMPLADEGLVVPFYVNGKAVGTIWAVIHENRRQFDAEDLRLLESLSRFASAAYQAVQSIDSLKLEIAAREKAEAAVRELANGLETQVRVRTQELEYNTERLQLLLDVTNQLVSHLELRDLLRAVSRQVRRVMHCDFASVSLPDAEKKQLRHYALDFPDSKGMLQEEIAFPVEGSPSGMAFRTMKPVAIQTPCVGFDAPIVQIATNEGLKSLCFLPLTSRNRAVGTLNLGRLRDDAFGEDDISFLTQVANQISLAVENALAYREIRELKDQLSNEKLYLEDEIRSELNFSQIVGSSPSLRRVLKAVETVAPTDSTVLIFGETGTGKELIARAIHDLSGRRSKTFVKLNCAAIPTGLLESELFGHEKGAFTGAIAQRIGRFEVANGGTIFLDEIGEIPLELQTKLLRVLQEKEFERLGSSRTLRTDARLIAATNRDLEAMVNQQKFRSDLFFRLNVFPVHVPPLRERQGDIPLLVRHFAQQFATRMNKVVDTIPSATLDALCRYPWPGNVRELQNVIERAVIISTGSALDVDVTDLKFPKTGSGSHKPVSLKSQNNNALHGVLEETERRHILDALNQSNWVVAGPNGAATLLGMKRSTLQKRMRKLAISRQLQ